MIPVFIASSRRFQEVEWLTANSVIWNTDSLPLVHVVRPEALGMREDGCTGFSMLRYRVPQWCRERGYEAAIYLDVDMLVLGDVQELWELRDPDKWICLEDGSTEVSVIGANVNVPQVSREQRHTLNIPMDRKIPMAWNCEDHVPDGAKLVHFTNLDTQPWFYDHPNAGAVALYESYRDRYRTLLNPERDRASQSL